MLDWPRKVLLTDLWSSVHAATAASSSPTESPRQPRQRFRGIADLPRRSTDKRVRYAPQSLAALAATPAAQRAATRPPAGPSELNARPPTNPAGYAASPSTTSCPTPATPTPSTWTTPTPSTPALTSPRTRPTTAPATRTATSYEATVSRISTSAPHPSIGRKPRMHKPNRRYA